MMHDKYDAYLWLWHYKIFLSNTMSFKSKYCFQAQIFKVTTLTRLFARNRIKCICLTYLPRKLYASMSKFIAGRRCRMAAVTRFQLNALHSCLLYVLYTFERKIEYYKPPTVTTTSRIYLVWVRPVTGRVVLFEYSYLKVNGF